MSISLKNMYVSILGVPFGVEINEPFVLDPRDKQTGRCSFAERSCHLDFFVSGFYLFDLVEARIEFIASFYGEVDTHSGATLARGGKMVFSKFTLPKAGLIDETFERALLGRILAAQLPVSAKFLTEPNDFAVGYDLATIVARQNWRNKQSLAPQENFDFDMGYISRRPQRLSEKRSPNHMNHKGKHQ